MLKTSHPENSIKTQLMMKPAFNLIWNCLKQLMQLPIKDIKLTNRPKHSVFTKFIREQKRVVKIMKDLGESTDNTTNGRHI